MKDAPIVKLASRASVHNAAAREIADAVCGGRPARCYGWKAKIWNAAYDAAIMAIEARQ